jgi:hypothetical protein
MAVQAKQRELEEANQPNRQQMVALKEHKVKISKEF